LGRGSALPPTDSSQSWASSLASGAGPESAQFSGCRVTSLLYGLGMPLLFPQSGIGGGAAALAWRPELALQ